MTAPVGGATDGPVDVVVDVAVVGGGLMGAATAWAATRRGLTVALFEQYEFGHSLGSSHGSARIFRRAYADPLYVSLTGRAYELWRELEIAAGTDVLRITGGLDHGSGRDTDLIGACLGDLGVAYELLPAGEAARRWPGMRFETPVLFHPDAGVIDADAAVRAFLEVARGAGAAVRPNTAVTGIEVADDGAVLSTANGPVRARRVVVAAGAWVAGLVGDLVPLPALAVTQQQIFHFPRADSSVSWPTFVHKDALNTYGLPGGRDAGPEGAQKLGEHDRGQPTTARTRDGVVDPEARTRMIEYVRAWLPGLVPYPFAETTCLYTTTANSDFVLDRLGPLVICSPCSGHGAKFAPLVGELATDLALDKPVADPRFAFAGHA